MTVGLLVPRDPEQDARTRRFMQGLSDVINNLLMSGLIVQTGPGEYTVRLGVAQGGTGRTTLTAHAVLVGEGTAAVGLVTVATAGRMFLDKGAALDPAFVAMSGDATLAGTGIITLATVTVPKGGTGLTTLTAHAVLLGNAAGNVTFATVATAGRLMIDQGASADPSFNVMSGDATLAAGGALTLATVNSNTGTFQGITLNAKGLATAAVVKGVVRLFSHHVDVGNGTTVETDLYSDTIAASQLAADDQTLEAEYAGVFVSSATATRQIKIYFAGTAIFDTGALTLSLSSAWVIYLTIIRVSATVIRYSVTMTTEGAALAAYTAVGELSGLTLSSSAVLKITGTAAGVGAASSDITAKLGFIEWRST